MSFRGRPENYCGFFIPKKVNLKIAFAIFLTVCYRTPAASGLTQEVYKNGRSNTNLWRERF